MPALVQKLKSLNTPHQRALRAYRSWVTSLPVDRSAVLLEQQSGMTLDGNVYCILRELLQNVRYAAFSPTFVATQNNAEAFSRELASRGLDVPVLMRGTADYMRALATSGVLITDNCLPPYFVKREGQTLVNTWHGIPLKTLGRAEITDAVNTGNVQRNFAISDFLLMPNDTMEKRMVRDYMLAGISSATILPLGYPRNEAFLRAGKHASEQRRYAWLPTFRGVGEQRGEGDATMPQLLAQVDALLGDDEALYLKLHLVERSQLDLDAFAHIRPAPTDVELYDFLATCDALVTDYSSVMYDFPLSGGKVVLFPYDEEQYLAERGLYEPLSSLPFPRVTSAEELVDELRSPVAYDNQGFMDACWPYPTLGSTETLCERLLFGGSPLPGEHTVAQVERPTVLVYSELGCDLDALRDELVALCDSFSPRLAFPWKKGRGHEAFLYGLPEQVSYTPLKGELLSTLGEKALLKCGKASSAMVLDRRRAFGDAHFDRVIIHDGSDRRWLSLIHAL